MIEGAAETMYYLIKIIISALLIVFISEISKKSSVIGAIFASIPLVSVLAICWLYMDTKNIHAVSKLSYDIFWLVIPSLLFFIALPICLKMKLSFISSMLISLVVMIIAYFLMITLLKQFGIKM